MDIVNAFIIAIVEGLTEFLPISSTAHLLLTANVLRFGGSAGGSFEIVIAPRASPGNWLPTGGVERYILALRFYDTAVGVATKEGREIPMPAIKTGSCR